MALLGPTKINGILEVSNGVVSALSGLNVENGMTVNGAINLNAGAGEFTLSGDRVIINGSMLSINTSGAEFNNGLAVNAGSLTVNSLASFNNNVNLTSGTLTLNSGTSLVNNGTSNFNGSTTIGGSLTCDGTSTFNDNIRFKENTIFSTENSPSNSSGNVTFNLPSTSIDIICPGFVRSTGFSSTDSQSIINATATKGNNGYVTITNKSSQSNISVTMSYFKKVATNSENSINIGKNHVYGSGIAIGSNQYVTTGTHIGCGEEKNKPEYLCLGVNGELWNHMTSRDGDWLGRSDYRDKIDILDIPSQKALDFIKLLNGKTFSFNFRDSYVDDSGVFDNDSYIKGTKKNERRQAGFIAQDTYQKMIDVLVMIIMQQ